MVWYNNNEEDYTMDTVPVAGNAGGSGDQPPQTPPTTPPAATPPPAPAPIAATAKVEVKDGKVVVDGKKFVAESDLIAAKNSLEGKLTTQQTAHDTAIDAARLEASTAQQTIATLNAKITENEEARKAGAVTDTEAASIKQELETAKSSIVTLTAEAGKALELRRANLVLQYGVVPDTIKDKDMKALDAFEEAIKAVSTARGSGPGPYAVGGGLGEAAPQTNIERAVKVLENTPVRGVREPAPQT